MDTQKTKSFVPDLSVFEWITLSASVLAVVVSVLGYIEARRATNLSEQAFQVNEKAIWRIQVDEKGYTFLDPNENVIGQQILLRTPKSLGNDEWNLMNSDRKYFITRVESDLVSELKKFIKEDKDFIKIGTIGFPVTIESYFYANGKTFEDTSLYTLNFTYQVPEPGRIWKITPTSAFFVGRVPKDEPETLAEEYWQTMLRQAFEKGIDEEQQ